MDQLPLQELLRLWQEFFNLLGTAAATLVGLMFVAVSIGAGWFTSGRRKVAINSFFSPTVVHFTAVLMACIAAIVPTQTWLTLGVLLVIIGGVGLTYSIWNSRRLARHGFTETIDLLDRMWYARLPIVLYVLVVAAGAGLLLRLGDALNLLAFGLALLMLAGIRNAWDMCVWILQHRD